MPTRDEWATSLVAAEMIDGTMIGAMRDDFEEQGRTRIVEGLRAETRSLVFVAATKLVFVEWTMSYLPRQKLYEAGSPDPFYYAGRAVSFLTQELIGMADRDPNPGRTHTSLCKGQSVEPGKYTFSCACGQPREMSSVKRRDMQRAILTQIVGNPELTGTTVTLASGSNSIPIADAGTGAYQLPGIIEILDILTSLRESFNEFREGFKK